MKTSNFILIAIMVTGSNTILAQDVFVDNDNIANNGYDLVSYFTNNSAQRGNKDFSSDHKGATYYFSNAANLKMFKNAPEKYLPQFGGFCSFGMGKMNQKVPVDPKTFRIDDGKLYLFYNDFWEGKPFNTIVPWLSDEAELEKSAHRNWEALRK